MPSPFSAAYPFLAKPWGQSPPTVLNIGFRTAKHFRIPSNPFWNLQSTIILETGTGNSMKQKEMKKVQNNQYNQTFQSMRTIINNLRQSEQKNVNLARQLAGQEANNAHTLNNAGQPNLQGMANIEAQAASLLSQFETAEKNAVQQLDQLDQMLSQLQSQMN